MLFVRLFGLCLFRFVGFLFLLGSFVIVALPGLFSYLFFFFFFFLSKVMAKCIHFTEICYEIWFPRTESIFTIYRKVD